jgi:hypothetical protein
MPHHIIISTFLPLNIEETPVKELKLISIYLYNCDKYNSKL